jgi:acetoacetyl-CoA synthetase
MQRVTQMLNMTTSEPPPEKLWSPSPERIRAARITAFTKWLARTRGLQFQQYESLWAWSVTDLEGFWAAVWEYFDIQATRPYQRVLAGEGMPFTRWFEGAELNFVTQVFHGREGSAAAIRFDSESLGSGALSWAELEMQVAALAATLRSLGVGPGDRVAAILPNVPHSVISFLAVASIGAVCRTSPGAPISPAHS